ncbi:hypothetical protein SAMN04488570_0323 [Nocardioides scoriae]|uniref:Uncharacterized protein n=1 Tax=Nocardioides scoriae TaxID=642780 RepID=A0A1H1LQM8_9ACTN|nr:hypothetical protein [Nocardioides scoriae]SDR76868.1 hypothetical protein SAMN04488570_0323 [Nocardioides scoriae]
MSRLLDPTVCPDCRAALDPRATCTGCGLQLRGELATRLWQTMRTADSLVEGLRAQPLPLPAEPGAAPVPPPADQQRHHVRLPAASVPTVLLGLGGLCLMVFALVFVGVAWDVLGLLGRTLVLLGVTGAVAAVADLVTRRGLRTSAEVLWLVTAGMLTVDVYAACSAGLLGLDALAEREVHALAGGTLLALGAGVATWVRTRRSGSHPAPVRELLGLQVVAVVGALVVTVAQAWDRPDPVAGSAVLVPLLGLLAWLLHRPVRRVGAGLAVLALLTWLVLLVSLSTGPATLGSPTLDLVAGSLLVVAAAAVASAASAVARAAGALTALGALWAAGVLVVRPLVALAQWSEAGRSPASAAVAPVTSPVTSAVASPAGWTSLLLAVVVLVAGAALVRLLERRPTSARRAWVALVPAVLAVGVTGLALTLDAPLWGVVLVGLVAAGTAGAAAWWARDDALVAWSTSAVAAYPALLATGFALTSSTALLPALTLTALGLPLLAALVLRDRTGSAASAGTLAVLAAGTGGAALGAWGLQLGVEPDLRALAVAAYAGLVALVAASTRTTAARLGLEATAAVLALVAVTTTDDDRAAAACLTVVGTAVALLAVLRRDRQDLGWVAAVVLAAATALRVVVEEPAPELVTLPAAALLVAAGAWRLHRERGLGSARVLGSGLSLALLPSLLLALGDPVSVRGALLGAAAVLTLAWGVTQRLTAPFVAGAAVTALLVLRHLEPVADAVPRWVTIGAVGVVLLVLGVTWESGLRNLARARRYLGDLR